MAAPARSIRLRSRRSPSVCQPLPRPPTGGELSPPLPRPLAARVSPAHARPRGVYPSEARGAVSGASPPPASLSSSCRRSRRASCASRRSSSRRDRSACSALRTSASSRSSAPILRTRACCASAAAAASARVTASACSRSVRCCFSCCRLPPPKYKLLQVAHRLAKVGEALLAACGSARAAFHHHFVTVGWDVLSRVFAGFLPHITGLAGLPARVTSPQQEAHTAARP